MSNSVNCFVYFFYIFFPFRQPCILSPIHFITGTAIELPIALYLGPSGHLSAVFPLNGILVKLSGNPCSLSHSTGVSLLTLFPPVTTIASASTLELPVLLKGGPLDVSDGATSAQ